MPSDAASESSFALDPQTWMDMLTLHALKKDMFSARTLMVIIEGLEQLDAARRQASNPIIVTRYQASIFERLLKSFNNPYLLKEVGQTYLEYRLPGIALKHFDLARQFAPKDRDIESLQKRAMMALGQMAAHEPSHSTLGEAEQTKPELAGLLHKATGRIPFAEARTELTEAAGSLQAKTIAYRQTDRLPPLVESNTVDIAGLLTQAQQLIEKTDYVAANAALWQAAQGGAPPEELQPLYAQLGLSAFDHDRLEDALDAFLRLRELGPEAVEGWFNCALVYQKMGDLEKALAAYQESARLDPDNSKVWCNLSSVWFGLGNHADSEAAARRALELRPDYVRAWDNLAAVLAAVNRLDEAAEACRKIIQLQPTFHAAWFKLGLILFQQESYVAAMEALQWTGDSPDFFAYVLYYMAMIEARRGNIDAAVDKLGQARSVDPANDLELSAVREIATTCTRFGRYAEAAAYYGQVVRKDPKDIPAWLGKGTAHHRADQFDEARDAYLRITEIDVNHPVAWHNLGLLASDQGDHIEACQCFRRETDLAPEDAKAWYDLGVSYQKLGREPEAEEAFDRAESLVKNLSKKSSDLSAALSIVHRLNLGERVLKT